jgi:hypothetical protein
MKKLTLKKVTLKDLDDVKLDQVAGGIPLSYLSGCAKCVTVPPTCYGKTC